MVLEYNGFWLTILIAVAFVFITIICIYSFQIVFGMIDGIDDRYVCFYADQYPYNELCREQKLQQLMQKYNLTD